MTEPRNSASRRWLMWGPLLVVAAWLALFGDKTPAGSIEVSLPSRPAPTQPPAASFHAPPARANTATPNAVALAALVPRAQLIPQAQSASAADAPVADRDPFSVRSWNPPPAPAAASAPVEPTAPPLPYAYIGKKQEGESWEVYLTRGDLTFVAREGEVLERDYRVEKIQPPSLTLVYLPLGEAQSLSIGEKR